MASRFPVVAVLGSLAWVAACGDPNSEAPCPEAEGEFPPTHCAFVQGRLTAAGVPIAGAGLLVDDLVPPVGYASVAAASARGPADDSLSVLMRFAPMGTLVDTTEAELTLP
jgi:hypothetical protein